MFATEEEALAAAEEAYARYLEVSDAIGADGGSNPERLEPLVTPEWFERELASFKRIDEQSIRQVGATQFRNAKLQQMSKEEILLYLCSVLAEVQFVDRSGNSVTPATRPAELSVQVTFELTDDELLLSGIQVWSDNSFC